MQILPRNSHLPIQEWPYYGAFCRLSRFLRSKRSLVRIQPGVPTLPNQLNNLALSLAPRATLGAFDFCGFPVDSGKQLASTPPAGQPFSQDFDECPLCGRPIPFPAYDHHVRNCGGAR